MDQTNEKQMKKTNPKDDLETAVFVGLFAGLFFLVSQIIAIIPNLSSDFIGTIYLIGDTLISAFGKIPLLLLMAIGCFLIATFAAIGLFMENEKDIQLYGKLLYIFWGIDSLVIGILGFYAMINPPIRPLIATTIFVLFIAPPFIFPIIKGITILINNNKS